MTEQSILQLTLWKTPCFLPLWCFKIPSFNMSFCLENFLLPFFWGSSAGEQILSFPMFQNVFISPLFFTGYIAGYRSLGWQFFFQHLKNIVSLSYGLHGLWWEICYSSDWFFPLKERCYFLSLAAFKIFSYRSLVFRSLIIICLGVDFFWFILFGFVQFLESLSLCYIKFSLENLQPLVLL